MPLHRTRAEEQPRTDLRVRKPITRKLGDLPLLRSQIIACLDRPLARSLTRSQQLFASPLSEAFHPHRREHVMREMKLSASVDPPPLPAQPLAIQQMRAGECGTDPAAL